jgi:hypothetical protein
VDGAIVDTDLIGQLLGNPRRVTAQGGLAGPKPPLPDAARLGRRMATLYATWQRGHLPDMDALAVVLLHRNGIPPDSALARTCRAAAAAVAAWGGLPYHSARHHAEVATNAMVMVELSDRQGHTLGRRATALLLAACLSHDLHYSPSVARKRFAAERASADALDTMARDAGCDGADRDAMRALILATEPGLRLRPGGPLGQPLDPTVARLLQGAAVDPALAGLGAILSDADLLSSVGLTPAWYRVQEDRLQREAGRPSAPDEAERFFRDIVGPDFLSEPGRVFSANLAAIRRAIDRAA